MKQYKLVDNILGWVVFVIAAFTYCSTIEPTASFWDCPEFIVTAFKQEIGHPPGAPFFMLLGNLFTQFASDTTQVAKMVNTMSALLSATCILFLFWTITHLTRKLLLDSWNDLTATKLIAIEASGLVGALIYCWSDTFWFSAVEGEVYAFSSAFTAVVFWLMLKWEDHADEPHSDRWLVLIMYMTGLSIGVHLLNLLCIPAMVLVFYYRRFPNANVKGSLLALLISFIIVAAVLYGVIPGIITVGGWFELFFVNTLGCPFNTGEIVYIVLLIASVTWGIWETYTDRNAKRQNIAFCIGFGMLGIPFVGYGWKAFVTGIIVLAAIYFILNVRLTSKTTHKRERLIPAHVKNTVLLCMLMLMIGYSSYALIVVRSSANPPMDQNSPEDIFTLGSYLSRDQYGDRPLIYGQAYGSQVKLEQRGNVCVPTIDEGAPIYQRKEKASKDEKDSYFVVSHKSKYVYAQNMLFPRMYSSQHAQAYESWQDVKGYTVPYDRCGESMEVKMPTFGENMFFFLSYQCNFMYWRYFMWNFAGRQNDIQGHGELEHGNWITGFKWFDNWRLGNQDKLPDELKAYDPVTNPSGNKGHNAFYCLPLLLGLVGLFWQAFRGERGIRQFWVVAFLFFMTGLAIVIYLNQTPMQPRERDYAYAGSFYAFAIWCGMGVAGIIDTIQRKLHVNHVALAALVAVLCLLVPIQMVSQTWDDHDRSNRYTCRDFGQNYLMSLQPGSKPIIFTNGDIDTFPLWYNQEVEGVGTDVRVCNLSYLQTDWYIDQMKRPAYDSPAVPITWPRLDFCSGTNEYVEVHPEMESTIRTWYQEDANTARELFGDNPFELKNIIKYWVRNDFSPSQKQVIEQTFGIPASKIRETLHMVPTDTVYITIDKNAVKQSRMLMAQDTIPDQMVISFNGKNALYKGDLMMLEMLSQTNWVRPLYVATTVGSDNYMNLGENFVQEGLANRITPFHTTAPNAKNFDTEKTYDAVMNRFKFGNLKHRGLYIDETTMRMCYTNRRIFSMLALQLIKEGKIDKAKKALAKVEQEIPTYSVPANYQSGGLEFAQAYLLVGNKKMARRYVEQTFKTAKQYADWYTSLPQDRFLQSQRDCMLYGLYPMGQAIELAKAVDKQLGQKYNAEFNSAMNKYSSMGGQMFMNN